MIYAIKLIHYIFSATKLHIIEEKRYIQNQLDLISYRNYHVFSYLVLVLEIYFIKCPLQRVWGGEPVDSR